MSWWHKIALGTVPVVGAFLCILLLQTSALVERAYRDEGILALGFKTALDTLNAECGATTHCGTLAEVDKTLTHASDLIVQTQVAVKHADKVSQTEAAMLPEWNKQITTTLSGINLTVSSFDANQDRLTASLVPVLNDTDATVKHLDDLVSSKYVLESLSNIDTSTAAFAESAKQISATVTDVRQETDKLTHPTKKKMGFWGGVWAVAQIVHKVSPPLF